MKIALNQLQGRIGHTFRQPELLVRAVTHPSYLQDHREEPESNQRLEFLGDSVLQVILTGELFQLYPADREGPLSQRRAALSNGECLARLARTIQLDTCLRLGAGEEQAGGRTRASTLEDAFEALIGAVYLDSDLATARRVVLGLYGPLPALLDAVAGTENPKGLLQELIQPVHGNEALRYETTHVAGADHSREYEAGVFLLERRLGIGRGPSKKTAEEAAAREALATLQGG